MVLTWCLLQEGNHGIGSWHHRIVDSCIEKDVRESTIRDYFYLSMSNDACPCEELKIVWFPTPWILYVSAVSGCNEWVRFRIGLRRQKAEVRHRKFRTLVLSKLLYTSF